MTMQKQNIFLSVVLIAVVLLCSLAIIPQMVRAEGEPVVAVPIDDNTNDLTQHDFQITSGGTYEFIGSNPNAIITVNINEGESNDAIIRLNNATLKYIRINSGLTYLETLDTGTTSVNKIKIRKGGRACIADEDLTLDSTEVENAGKLKLKGAQISLKSIKNINSATLTMGENGKDSTNITLQSFENNGYATIYGNLIINKTGLNGVRLHNNGKIKIIGYLDNSGYIHNEPNAKIENVGTLMNTNVVENKGTFHNNGTFDNSNGTFTETELSTSTNDGTWIELAKSDEESDEGNDLSKYSYKINTNENYTFIGGDAGNHFIWIEGNAWPRLDLSDIMNMGEIVVGDSVQVQIFAADSGTTITGNEGEPGVKLGKNGEFHHLSGKLTINGGGDTEISNCQGDSVPVYDIAGWDDTGAVNRGKVVVKDATLNALVFSEEGKCELYGERTLSGTLEQPLHVTAEAELTISPQGSYIVGVEDGTVDGAIFNHGKIEIYDGTLCVSQSGNLMNRGIIQKGSNNEKKDGSVPGCLLVEGHLTNEVDAMLHNEGGNITVRPDGSFINEGIIYTEDGTIKEKEDDSSQGIDLIPTLGGTVYLYNLGNEKYSLDLGTPDPMYSTNITIGDHQYKKLFPNLKIDKLMTPTMVIPKEEYTLDYTVQSVTKADETGDYTIILSVAATGQNHAYGVLQKEISIPITIDPVPYGKSVSLVPKMPYHMGEKSEHGRGWTISGKKSGDDTPIMDASIYSPGNPFYVSKGINLTFTEVTK